MTDYEKIFQDIEDEDNAYAASVAITPDGGIPTVRFDGSPATAKAVLRSTEPQKNVNEWDELSTVEKAWNSVTGGVHNLQKSNAVSDIIEKKQAADAGLSALFGSDDMDLDEESMEKFRAAYADPTVGRQYKKQKEKELDEAIWRYADLVQQDSDYFAPTVVSAASKATEGKGFWESIPAWFAEVSKDPFDYALYIAGSSAGAIAPFLATSMAGGFALNAFKLNAVARAVQAATMGAGSYNVEFGSYIENYLAEKGYDLSNIESIKSALDKEDVNAIREKAFRRAAVVGAFDAISAWIAPIRLNPSNALRTLRRGVAEGVQDVALPASRLHRVGKGLENMTLQTTLQGVMGGAGEAFGQLVNGEKINWGEVFAEAIGEFTTAPVEVVGLAYSANANFNRETTIARNAQEINKNLQDLSNVVTAVAAKLPDNGSLQQWCEAVGKDKTLFAFAQDVIDSGAIEKLKEVAPALAQQVIEAAEKKSDVNVPVSDILKLSATDEATARKLLNDVRLTADGMSPNQAEKFLKEGKKGIVEKFQKIVDDAKPDIELRKAIKVETDKIANELVSTGTTKDVADLQVLPWASWLAVRAKQTGMKPSEIMEKVRLRIQGEQTNEGALNQSASTALPSAAAVKSALYPDPLFAHLWADYNEAKKNQTWFATALAKMRSIPGLKGATRGMRNPDNIGEKIVQRIAENLVWLYDKVPENLRQRSKLWYDGGRKVAETWAQRYGLRARQTAAIIAIFSPQTGWFANMSMAERLLDVYFSARRQKADQAMLDWFDTDQGKGYNKADIEGKSLEELIQANDFRRAAIWVRAYDKAHNSEARHALSPEGGTLDIEMTPTGSGPARTSYMTNKSIETALSVIVDGSVDNIFKQIGSDFKVRDFYNKIFNPGNQNAVTIDTHAVGAGLLSVVSSNDSVVEDNFGNPGNAPSGQKGTYPIYFEAYRRAAQKLGILPRELQSITWEAIRALFDSSEKRKLRPQVEAIWKKVDKGEITAEQAREEIFDLAGGFSKTAWEDTKFNNEITQTYDRSHVKLYDDIVQPNPEPVLTMEVVPNPNDKRAVARWNQLTEESKLSVTRAILPWVLDKVALLTKTHIDLPKLQRGGYKGTPNYSMCCEVEEGGDVLQVAQILGKVLRQESIMLVSVKQSQGTSASKLIRIKLPDGYTTEQIDKLYSVIDGIRDAQGKRLLEGHSTVNGIMTISADPAKIEEIESSLTSALAEYEDDISYDADDGYVGFIEPLKENKNATAQNDTGGIGTVQEGTPTSVYDNLRSQTDEKVAALVRKKLKEQRQSKTVQQTGKVKPDASARPLTQRDVARALEQLGYHGSPYHFDRFTLSNIGSGEGAQAHGWGLYFALSRRTADGYRERLAGASTYTYNGKSLEELHNELYREHQAELKKPNSPDKLAKLALLTSKMLLLTSFTIGGKAAAKVEKTAPKRYQDAYKWLTEEVYPNLKLEKGGKVYTVEIPDDDVMLREEKKISEQSEFIQNAVRKATADMKIKQDAEEVEDFLDGLENSDLGGMPKTIEKIKQMFSNNDERLSSDVSIAQALKDAVHQDAVDIYEWNKEDNDANDITVEEIESNCQKTLTENFAEITSMAQKNGIVDIGSLTGREVYSLLKNQFLSARSTSLYLNKFGIKGMRYEGARDGECAVVWDEESIKILNALEQSMQSGPRGMYMPQNTSDTNSMSGVMTLMQTRDKSTFLHESAHVWLDADTMLAKNIAEKVKSGQEITDGEKAFLKNLGGFFRWGQSEGVIDLGVTDDISTVADAVIRWSQMTTNDQRMMHELFAEGFESYLLEGTAPNPEMRTVFGRFKKWLMDIYARATKQPRPISREVRKLYDLMFVTQQQAQDTETRLGLQAMFKAADAKKLGMTDAEVQAYEELQEQATLETEGLVAKMVRGTMRIFGKARQDEIARIEKDKEAIAKKEAELLEEPRYRAVAMLNARQTVLDIRQMQGYDTDTIDALDAKGWISHDGGVSPDVLASMAGTTDAVGLIGDILDIDTVGDAHDEALRILAFEERKEFGDEGVFDELRANLAAYNDTRSRLLTAEYNAIARMLGNQQILRSAAREYAIEQIGNTKMSDLHPYTFVQAEQRCAREAEEALRKGDYAACLEAKRGQVLNHELARAALEAQERMDKGIRAVRRAMKSKTIHPQYKQLIAALVNAHAISIMTKAEREEFAKVEVMPPKKTTEFLAKLEENGTPVDGVAEFLQTHEHVQDMTAYTAEDFFGVVKQVATLGRNVLNQSLTEIAESVKEVVALGKEKLNEAADVQGRKVLKNQRSPMTRKERALNSVAQFLLGNVKIQSWCRIFDRNKDGGFFWNLFIRSANEHANFEAEQRARCSQVLREKLLPAFKKSQDEDPITIPGFDRPFTHGMRLAVALNLGNESNKRRLITNDPCFTTEALQAIMDSLTEADWRAVEAVWQLFESFKTAIGEKELRVYGVEPEWIKYEPFKVKTKEGKTITVSGGYYPVKYDPVASNKVDKRTDAEATEQDLRGAYQSATTRRSFTQSRVTGDVTDMPLRLDLTALYEGLNDVIHDLAWHEWLIDTKRVLDGAGGPDSGLRAAIKERYGYNVAKEFEEWRKDIALGGRSEGSSEALSFCLRNVGMATMGYSLTSAVVQLTGAGYVIPRTGVKAFTVALGKYLTSPLKTRRFVNSQSQAMLLRAQTQFKELAQIRNRLDQGKGFRAWMVDHAYSMMTFMQGIVDSVCWQAAYEKFSRQGYEGKELTALCDQTVIDTQSSGNISDLSRIERDKRGLARMMTMFYSWMNAVLNMVVTTGMSEENKAKKIASLFWMCAVMPLIEQTFRDSLAAKGDDDDDDDDELAWMREDLGTIVEFNLGLLPVTREFSTAAESLVKGEPVFDYRGPAGLRLLSNVAGGIKTLANPDERKIARAITDLGGSLLGLPSVQINRTVKGVRAINSGQAEGVDAIKAPFFGFKGKIDD